MAGIFYRIILLTVSLLFVSVTYSADLAQRHALVIGNGNYQHLLKLDNPVNDATAISRTLSELGFAVTTLTDVSRDQMLQGISLFRDSLDRESVALLYYAGHGIQHENKNYLIPVDANLTENQQLQSLAVGLDTAVNALKTSGAPLRIFMLDACRDNPLQGTRSATRTAQRTRGLASIDANYGTIFSYATDPGKVAYDGQTEHSPYTEALLKHLPVAEQSISDMLNAVGNEVLRSTGYTQTPWQSSSPIPPFCFAGCNRDELPDNLQQIVASFSKAVEQRDLTQLSSFTPSDPETTDLFSPLFSEYDNLKIRSIGGEISDINTGEIDLVIQEARTRSGKVYPASAWGQIKLAVKRQGDAWQITDIVNNPLVNHVSTSQEGVVVDFRAPDITIPQTRFAASKTGKVTVSARVIDDTGVNSVDLFYRPRGSRQPFISIPMLHSETPDALFTGQITDSVIINGGVIEIYVEASDRSGNRTQYPWSSQPQTMTIKKKTNWAMIGLGILATGALIAVAGGDSGGDEVSAGSDRQLTITTPLP